MYSSRKVQMCFALVVRFPPSAHRVTLLSARMARTPRPEEPQPTTTAVTLISLPSDALTLVLALVPSESLVAAAGSCHALWSAVAAAAAARATQLGCPLPLARKGEPASLLLRFVELVVRPPRASIAAGGAHTVAVGLELQGAKVMAWGGDPDDFNNHVSQLGHGNLTGEAAGLPLAVQGLDAVSGRCLAVAAGDYVSCVLTEGGECWTWGRPHCSLLGRHEPREEADAVPNQEPHSAEAAVPNHGQGAELPRHIAAGLSVQAVACGASHCLLLAGGRLHSWGWGESGALGHGMRQDELLPRLIDALPQVRHCSAGDAYTLAVSAHGELYAWGEDEYGRLGLGDESGTHLIPEAVRAPLEQEGSEATSEAALWRAAAPRFTRCCGARNHSLGVCARGDVYSFGSGDMGVLGHGDCRDRLRPSRVIALHGILEAAAGWHHSACLDCRGRVFTFGLDGGQGVLGHADRFVDDELQPWPRLVASLLDETVIEVVCGAHHTVVRTQKGAVLTCGEGRKGALGTGGFESNCEFLPVLDKLETISRLQRERDALMAKLRRSAEEIMQHLSLEPQEPEAQRNG